MRILVIDDNRLLATILADHLISRGHDASAAFDGHLAEIFCERNGYDLLVIDMVLPEIDGVDLLERLRLRHDHCRAIFITGFSELHEKETSRLEHLEVDAVLEKPFSFSDVDAIVDRMAA
jgi:DNA-binding response OmpR family regulator